MLPCITFLGCGDDEAIYHIHESRQTYFPNDPVLQPFITDSDFRLYQGMMLFDDGDIGKVISLKHIDATKFLERNGSDPNNKLKIALCGWWEARVIETSALWSSNTLPPRNALLHSNRCPVDEWVMPNWVAVSAFWSAILYKIFCEKPLNTDCSAAFRQSFSKEMMRSSHALTCACSHLSFPGQASSPCARASWQPYNFSKAKFMQPIALFLFRFQRG